MADTDTKNPSSAPPKGEARDPLTWLLLVLSSVTGLVDAISIIGMGRVFVANMTGNIVFLGFAIGGAPDFHASRYITALLAFIVGAWAGGLLGKSLGNRPHRHWLMTVAAIEAVLFFAAAWASVGFDFQNLVPQTQLYLLIALTAAAMGVRNATVRKLKVQDVTTTVLTLTVTGLAADSSLAGGDNKNWGRRVASIATILVGAIIGAVLVLNFGLAVPLVLCGVLVFGVTALYAVQPASSRTAEDKAK